MGPGFTLETALGQRDLGGGTGEGNEPSWSLSQSQGTDEQGAGGSSLTAAVKLFTVCGEEEI